MATETDQYATKQDLHDLGSAIREEMAGMRAEMAEMRTGMRAEMAEMRTGMAEIRAEMAEMRTEMREGFSRVERRLDDQDQMNAALLPAIKVMAKHVGVSEG